jgi:hypothetical protein
MALGILSLVLVSSYALATGTFRLGRGAGERTQAVNYLQQQAEALRAYRNQVTWPEFAQTVSGLSANGATFCMTPPKPTDVVRQWLPVASSNAGCTINGILITVTSPTPGSASELYDFNFAATWKTASQDNNVTLTTKLTRQGQ